MAADPHPGGFLRRLFGRLRGGPRDPEMAHADQAVGWVPFDEQRRDTQFRRADIVFGPDMFDPRTENGDRPLTRAMRERRSDVDPDDLEKTVGEVFGEDATDAEIRQAMLSNARSIDAAPAGPGGNPA
jgi:hypothetical protein